jgi:hypothetical protein
VTLVSVDELLRDLAAMAAYPANAEFRKIEVVAIETRERLKVKLALFAIPAVAINAFQEICRDIIVFRERPGGDAPSAETAWHDVIGKRLAAIRSALNGGASAEMIDDDRLSVQDAMGLQRHMEVLRNAAMPLRRVEVKKD